MIQYSADGLTAFYGGYKFRKDRKTGYFLCNKKTDIGKRERLHCFVWRTEHGQIPSGYHIHHKDGNKNNNEISNLEMLSSSDHERLHGQLLTEEEREKRRKNIVLLGVPAAVKWHKSAAGHEWHVEHGKKCAKERAIKQYRCVYCGNEFQSKYTYGKNQNTFCSNNCKAAYRRKSGVDNEKRVCRICGREYQANKYTNTSRCPACRSSKH